MLVPAFLPSPVPEGEGGEGEGGLYVAGQGILRDAQQEVYR